MQAVYRIEVVWMMPLQMLAFIFDNTPSEPLIVMEVNDFGTVRHILPPWFKVNYPTFMQ